MDGLGDNLGNSFMAGETYGEAPVEVQDYEPAEDYAEPQLDPYEPQYDQTGNDEVNDNIFPADINVYSAAEQIATAEVHESQEPETYAQIEVNEVYDYVQVENT